jgi:beta-lactamase regulating signal transducer with metallopeptidase domain
MNYFDSAFGLLADAAVKGVLILALAEMVLLPLVHASAATRHVVRMASLMAVLILPLALWWAPAASKPIWTISTDRAAGNELALTLTLGTGESAKAINTPPAESTFSKSEPRKATLVVRPEWAWGAVCLWMAGVLGALVPFIIGLHERRQLAKSAASSRCEEWKALLAECRRQLQIGRSVRLVESQDEIVPITWGTLRPVILLPSCAHWWSDERVRLTLLHELAHVQRWDCLAQSLALIVCALHWFNPLAWRMARAMRLDREQACDDLVLGNNGRASSYAEHLVEIASGLRALRASSGVPMARRSQLEQRVSALLATRSRRVPGGLICCAIAISTVMIVTVVAAQKTEFSAKEKVLREKQLSTLKEFSARKEHQAEILVRQNKEEFFPEFREFFSAAKAGDWQTVTNMYVDFRHRHSQYSGAVDDLPHTPYWQTVLEVCLAYADVTWGQPEHVQFAIDGFLKSIPAGAIYFGGTDPGRGFPTAFSRDHQAADPFFTITQNALADSTYLKYLQLMYGRRLYVPSEEDSQNSFAEYVKGATQRFRDGQLKPGENVSVSENRTSVSGQTAVMGINALLARIIFDKNPDREFYIEESFPLDWMYPYLVPTGQVMRITREPLASLSGEVIKKDTDYWNVRLDRFLGTRIREDLSTKDFLAFVERVYVKHELPRRADPKFFANDWAQRAFSKWRSGIAGVYAWRATSASDPSERARMAKVAEHALRDAYALCPNNHEVERRYTEFLRESGREPEATLVSETSSEIAQ